MQGARLKLRDQLLKNQAGILRQAVLRLPVFVKPQTVKTLRRDKKRSTLISFQKRLRLKRWIANNRRFCGRNTQIPFQTIFRKWVINRSGRLKRAQTENDILNEVSSM
ncbi:Hypothetical_protein [Hexamita inflata]|uniref:Hypothetical_protein n=1 Tax=Hexamita inflata TaxID=28002 RepID=A0AA86Q9L6_9EUKA|nr:Hypothetical protein HINF_LOCUS16086 [Hexamita inflata]CAI9954886.1 Hypothetical protein HINF_LOCUS42531 [Hexamita inflata]